MEEEERTRTSASGSRSVACWHCYRSHRACDGNRPCNRCIALQQESECHDPLPCEKIKQKKRKRKREKALGGMTQEGEEDETEGEEKGGSRKRNRFFVVDPRSFSSLHTFSYYKPSALKGGYYRPTPPSSSPQQPQHQEEDGIKHSSSLPPQANELIDQVQYGGIIKSLLDEQILEQQQLLYILTASPNNNNSSSSSTPLTTTTAITTNLYNLALPPSSPSPSPSSSSSLLFFQPTSHIQMVSEDAPQPEELTQNLFEEFESNNKEEQLEELHPILRERPLPDANQFGQSMFMPFVLQNPNLVPFIPCPSIHSSLSLSLFFPCVCLFPLFLSPWCCLLALPRNSVQPFFVYNLLGDFQPLAQAMATGSAFRVPFQAILLATNASLSPTFQYNKVAPPLSSLLTFTLIHTTTQHTHNQEEISGPNLNKLAGPLIRIVESPDLLQRLAPQPLNPTSLVGPVNDLLPFLSSKGWNLHPWRRDDAILLFPRRWARQFHHPAIPQICAKQQKHPSFLSIPTSIIITLCHTFHFHRHVPFEWRAFLHEWEEAKTTFLVKSGMRLGSICTNKRFESSFVLLFFTESSTLLLLRGYPILRNRDCIVLLLASTLFSFLLFAQLSFFLLASVAS